MATSKILPYQSRFDGSDTQDAIRAFMEQGGGVNKCPTHAPATGNIRYNFASRAYKAEKGISDD